MIIEFGFIVACGLLFTFCKLSWQWRIWMLSKPLQMDLGIFVFLNMMHWGTFSGLMVAATGALVCSGCISIGRYLFGYVNKAGYYIPGVVEVKELTRK